MWRRAQSRAAATARSGAAIRSAAGILRCGRYRRAYAVLVGVADNPATHAEHTLLVEALRRRDAQDAAHVLELHIRRTRVELAKHPDVFDTD